jgi:hypothetical protein
MRLNRSVLLRDLDEIVAGATLNDLKGAERAAFPADMAAVGDAVLAVRRAVRVNYAIFGNEDPALHARDPAICARTRRIRGGTALNP